MLQRNRFTVLLTALIAVATGVGLALQMADTDSDEVTVEADVGSSVHKAGKRGKKARGSKGRREQRAAGLDGRWRKAPAPVNAAQAEEIQSLEALGYVSGSVPFSAQASVTINKKERVFDGVNFYSSGHGPEATLMDMDGRILHSWRMDFSTAFPGREITAKARQSTHHWRRAILLEGGDVLAIFEGQGIIRLDKDSKLIWANPTRAHHDAHVLPNGDLYVLSRVAHLVPEINQSNPILEDFIVLLDGKSGEEKYRLSVLEAFEQSAFREVWRTGKKKGDLMHTNAIEILDGRLTEVHPAFQAGRALISMRVSNTLAVVDLALGQVVWAHAGSYRKQHDPRTLDNGRILLFDNMGGAGPSSRVLELDPQTGKTQVLYKSTQNKSFYTEFCGTSIRMSNGNILATESDQGRAFEFTPDREIVWEFHNPARAGDNLEFIASLFEVERFARSYVAGWLH